MTMRMLAAELGAAASRNEPPIAIAYGGMPIGPCRRWRNVHTT